MTYKLEKTIILIDYLTSIGLISDPYVLIPFIHKNDLIEQGYILNITFCIDQFKKYIFESNDFIILAIKKMMERKQNGCSFHFSIIENTSTVVFSIKCKPIDIPNLDYESYVIRRSNEI